MLQSGQSITATQIATPYWKSSKIKTFESWQFETKILILQDEAVDFFYFKKAVANIDTCLSTGKKWPECRPCKPLVNDS